MGKCLEHCIGKYIKSTGLEYALIECKLIDKKTIEQVLNGTHHARSLLGIIMLSEAIEKLKLDAFSKVYGKEKYSNITSLNKLALELLSKSETDCNRYFEKCKNNIKTLQQDFVSFSEKCSEKSEVCRYWDDLINLSTLLKSLIACDRNGDWEGHLQIVQKLLPVFRESDSINYLRYESFYIEKMPKLPIEHPYIYKEFVKVKLLVKTQIGNFNGLSPDVTLEQTIQSSKKYAAGIIGQIRQLFNFTICKTTSLNNGIMCK